MTAAVLTSARRLRLSEGVVADPPVVLAPMAGITNVAFRRLCREHGAGLFISEMITSRALVERNPKTMRLTSFAEDDRLRWHPGANELAALRGRPGHRGRGGADDR